MSVGSRAEVMHGNADNTSGGLKKSDLKYNKNGRIVSKRKSEKMKKEKGRRLKAAGFTLSKKGQKFGPKKSQKNKSKKNKTARK